MVYAGISKDERIKKAEELLKEVGLGDRMTHTSNQLSWRQMKRVAIARALSMNRAILLADEHNRQIFPLFRRRDNERNISRITN